MPVLAYSVRAETRAAVVLRWYRRQKAIPGWSVDSGSGRQARWDAATLPLGLHRIILHLHIVPTRRCVSHLSSHHDTAPLRSLLWILLGNILRTDGRRRGWLFRRGILLLRGGRSVRPLDRLGLRLGGSGGSGRSGDLLLEHHLISLRGRYLGGLRGRFLLSLGVRSSLLLRGRFLLRLGVRSSLLLCGRFLLRLGVRGSFSFAAASSFALASAAAFSFAVVASRASSTGGGSETEDAATSALCSSSASRGFFVGVS